MFANFPFDRVNWFTSSFLILTFLVSLIGVPLFFVFFGFDWFYFALFAVFFILTGMSITLGYHRLFAHRSFDAKKPVKLFTLLFGAAAFEDSALDWASDHRQHHKHVDDEHEDPYSISRGFFWAHMGWIFFKLYPRELANVGDLKKDQLVMWQHRHHRVIGVAIGLLLPTLIGALYGGMIGAFGGLLFGGVARLVAVQHCTFFINSLCHTIGRRPYDSKTSARDSWIMAIFTFGEGYHNYHHSFQHDYRNGVKPWQWDPTKWAIWCLSKVGLVSKMRKVAEEKIVLAEIRETRRRAEEHLNEHRQWYLSCPNREAAAAKLAGLSRNLGKGYTELEESLSSRIRLSKEKLRYWKDQVTDTVEHLSILQGMQPGIA
ncbi:MAG: acyl-CoA desaturase [Verrucomicrobiota bacterium]